MEIKPFIGIDNIILGMNRNEIISIMGIPDHKETETWGDNSISETWKYKESSLEFTFDSEDDYLLSTITSYSSEIKLLDKYPIGLSEKKLIGIFPSIVLEDDFQELGKNYHFPEYEISFWVINGIVENLSLFPQYEDDDETIVWPKRS